MKYISEKDATYLIDATGLVGCRIYDVIALAWKPDLYVTIHSHKVHLIKYNPEISRCSYWKKVNGSHAWYYSSRWIQPRSIFDREVNYTYVESLPVYIKEEAFYGMYKDFLEIYAPTFYHKDISNLMQISMNQWKNIDS